MVLASAIALGAATAAGYVLSVLQEGGWKYTDLIAPICGLAVIVALAAGLAAYISRRNRGVRAIVRMAGLLTLGYCAAAAGLYFAVLSNCRFSCGNKVLAEARSPDGRWKAVTFSKNCVAMLQVCPPLSQISVLPVSRGVPDGEGNVFSGIVDDRALEVRWTSPSELRVRYSGRVLLKREQADEVRVKFQEIGWM